MNPSQLTTQTSNFIPNKAHLSKVQHKPSTSYSSQFPYKKYLSSTEATPPSTPFTDIKAKFKTLIEDTIFDKPEASALKLKKEEVFHEDENNNNSLKISKRPKPKKLTFLEKTKQEETENEIFENLTRAKEMREVLELKKRHLTEEQPHKNLTVSQRNNKRRSSAFNLFIPNFSGKNINSKEESDIKEQQFRKTYEPQSKFLHNIVKIHKPKFEVKIDFLNKNELHKNYKNFLFAQTVLVYIKNQCKIYSAFGKNANTNIKSNKKIDNLNNTSSGNIGNNLNNNNNNNIKNNDFSLDIVKFKDICQNTYTQILQLFPLIRQAIDSIKSRNNFDKIFHEIEIKCQQTRNMGLTLKTLLLHAKVIFLLQDTYKAIIIYKNCKKLAVMFNLFPCLISCYKGLGRCFQFMKEYKRALSYYSKMLQCAWKINDLDHEILAYDLIGMQYYYLGDLEKSKYYHKRMVDGEKEPDSSNVKKLAVANFLNKKSKNHNVLQDQSKFNENPLSQFTDNILESSDEDFELPNPISSKRNQSEPDVKKFLNGKSPKKKNKKTIMPGENLIAIIQKSRKEKAIGTMKSTEEFKKLFSKNLSEGRFNKKAMNNEYNQEKVLISHLSPNRELKTYQLFKPIGIRNINFYNINDYLYENDDNMIKNKIKEKLKTYAEKLLLTINKLKAIFSKTL